MAGNLDQCAGGRRLIAHRRSHEERLQIQTNCNHPDDEELPLEKIVADLADGVPCIHLNSICRTETAGWLSKGTTKDCGNGEYQSTLRTRQIWSR